MIAKMFYLFVLFAIRVTATTMEMCKDTLILQLVSVPALDSGKWLLYRHLGVFTILNILVADEALVCPFLKKHLVCIWCCNLIIKLRCGNQEWENVLQLNRGGHPKYRGSPMVAPAVVTILTYTGSLFWPYIGWYVHRVCKMWFPFSSLCPHSHSPILVSHDIH